MPIEPSGGGEGGSEFHWSFVLVLQDASTYRSAFFFSIDFGLDYGTFTMPRLKMHQNKLGCFVLLETIT